MDLKLGAPSDAAMILSGIASVNGFWSLLV